MGTLIAGIKLYGTGDADTFLNDEIFPLDKPQILQSIDSIGSVLALVHPDIPLDQAEVDGIRQRAHPIDATAAMSQEVHEE